MLIACPESEGLQARILVDQTSEAVYWRDNFQSRPYAENATSFDDYGPAYLRLWCEFIHQIPGPQLRNFNGIKPGMPHVMRGSALAIVKKKILRVALVATTIEN